MKFNNRNVYIASEAKIGKNVKIGDNTTIYANVIIEDDTIIANDCIIGEPLNDYYNNPKYHNPETIIGQNSLIRSHTIIYAGSTFGNNFQTGHRVTIREFTKVGNFCSFGTNNDIQGDCEIGNYCRFQSFVNIGQKSKISNFVFIYPFVVLTNDPNPPSNTLIGSNIDDYAQIASGAIILPGRKVGKHSLVAANITLNIDVPEFSLAAGTPAKIIGDLRKMPFFNNNKRHYPWPYNYESGMPWENLGFDKWVEENK
jgi:acetyltransferase-like isoleucine patch superfamily enzyme